MATSALHLQQFLDMARRVFFAFHYQNDIWRVNQVRNSWLTYDNAEEAGFFDYSLWEESKKVGDAAVKRMIDEALKGTSVTVILLGAQTASRPYVKYELEKSYSRGNGLLAIWIHRLENQGGYSSTQGENIFSNYTIDRRGQKVYLSEIFKTYDWMRDDGYNNLGAWVEEAARIAGA